MHTCLYSPIAPIYKPSHFKCVSRGVLQDHWSSDFSQKHKPYGLLSDLVWQLGSDFYIQSFSTGQLTAYLVKTSLLGVPVCAKMIEHKTWCNKIWLHHLYRLLEFLKNYLDVHSSLRVKYITSWAASVVLAILLLFVFIWGTLREVACNCAGMGYCPL